MIPTNRFVNLSVLIMTLVLSQSVSAQGTPSNKFSIIAALGIHESIVASINMPFYESVNVGVKLNRIVTGGGKNSVLITGLGFGITSSFRYSNDDSFLNVANLELAYLYHIFEVDGPSKGFNYQVTVGHRNETKGFHLIWGVGVGFTTFANSIEPYSMSYLFPCLQIGVQWNQ